MTTPDLPHLKALAEKATAAPWQLHATAIGGIETPDGLQIAQAQATRAVRTKADHAERIANADLIVAMRNALPALLARLEAAEENRDAAIREMDSQVDIKIRALAERDALVAKLSDPALVLIPRAELEEAANRIDGLVLDLDGESGRPHRVPDPIADTLRQRSRG